MYDVTQEYDAMEDQDTIQAGDRVWLQPMATWAVVEAVTNDGYKLEGRGVWSESFLRSVEERECYLKQYAAGVEARAQYDADIIAHLEETEPVRRLFETDEEYERFYVQWAYGFCGVEMPEDVKHFYYKYLIKNRWVVQSG